MSILRYLPFLVLCLAAASVSAQGTQWEVKIGLHLEPVVEELPCVNPTSLPSSFGCDLPNATSNVNFHGEVGREYTMYIVVLDVDPEYGVGGLSFGLQWDSTSLDISEVTNCADYELPGESWPAPGTGNLLMWSGDYNCQGQTIDPTDPQCEGAFVAYSMRVYAYDTTIVQIVSREDVPQPDLRVADCQGSESDLLTVGLYPTNVGAAAFGEDQGHNPCVCTCNPKVPPSLSNCLTPVEETTWGSVKALFGRED
jgi:hypothetical protein